MNEPGNLGSLPPQLAHLIKASKQRNSGDHCILSVKKQMDLYDPRSERDSCYFSPSMSSVQTYGTEKANKTCPTDEEKEICPNKKMKSELDSSCSYYSDDNTNVWNKRRKEYEQRNSRKLTSQCRNPKPFSNDTEDKWPEDSRCNSEQSEEGNNKESWRTKVSHRNLIVNYLSSCVTDNDLYKAFRPFGKIQSVRVMKDLKAGYSFGFGFVNFIEDADGERAKDALNDSELRNKKIKVNYSRPACEDTQQSNLYVGNLPRSATEDDVLKMFSPYGEILQFNLLWDKILNIPRGVAFVRYRERNDALRAVLGMNGHKPEGFQEPIKVRIAMDYGRQRAASFNAGHRHDPCSQSSQKGHSGKKTPKSHGKSHRQSGKSTKETDSSNSSRNMHQKNRDTVRGKYKSKKDKR